MKKNDKDLSILPIGYTTNLNEIIDLQELHKNAKSKMEQNKSNKQHSTRINIWKKNQKKKAAFLFF